jgi:hypothetical protein
MEDADADESLRQDSARGCAGATMRHKRMVVSPVNIAATRASNGALAGNSEANAGPWAPAGAASAEADQGVAGQRLNQRGHACFGATGQVLSPISR